MIDDDLEFVDAMSEMSLPFGFQPDETWLPVKTVLKKPVKPELLLATISENIRKG